LARCTKCGETKPRDAFRFEPRNRDQLRSNCKDCDRAYARVRQRETEQYYRWRAANPEAAHRVGRRSHLLNRYGITIEQYEALVVAQDGCCAICGSDNPRSHKRRYFAIDHDHITGKIRGLLCIPCNTGIGGLQDDPALLESALRYLRHGVERAQCEDPRSSVDLSSSAASMAGPPSDGSSLHTR
jgi:hypothetical protein